MNQHFSEADLLETYYTQPGESMPVMMHLADCADCAARYERLEKKLRGLTECEHHKPETFWARQRISILRRVAADRPSMFARHARIAAAAALALVLGGVVALRDTPAPANVATIETASTEQSTSIVTQDPWESDALNDYQSMVAWETWVDDETSKTGDQSL